MTVDDVLKRARANKNQRAKWELYTRYKNDIERVAKTSGEYQAAIKKLAEALKV